MAEEEYNPFPGMTVRRWGADTPESTSNAAADPPAASVAVDPEPDAPADVPEVSAEETPPPEATPDEAPAEEEAAAPEAEAEQQRSRRPIAPRISELTKERNAAELAAARAEGRAEALQEAVTYWQQQALGQAPGQAPPPPPDGLQRDSQGRVQRPREHDYATTEAYHQALDVYDQARDSERTAAITAQIRSQMQAETALAAVKAAKPDYDEAVGRWHKSSRIDQYAQAAISNSPERFFLCHHLATHPDENARLERLSGFDAILAVGALAERLRVARDGSASAPAPVPSSPEPRASTPPPLPIPPTRGRSTPAPQGYDGMSFAEFKKLRDKEEAEAHR